MIFFAIEENSGYGDHARPRHVSSSVGPEEELSAPPPKACRCF